MVTYNHNVHTCSHNCVCIDERTGPLLTLCYKNVSYRELFTIHTTYTYTV